MDEGLDPAGVAVFIAAICGVVALACTQPEQWGFRRIAFGIGVCSAAAAALVLAPSPWWYSAILWGVYQAYLGWSYVARRKRTTHERIEYIESSAAVLAYVALADGRVDPREAGIIRETYARAGFSPHDLREVDQVVQRCQKRFLADGSDPERLFVLLRNACTVVLTHSNEQTRFNFLRAAIIIAASDGFVSSAEERALRASASWLGIAESDYNRLWRSVLSGDPDESEASERGTTENADTGTSGHEAPVVPPDLGTYYAAVLGIPLTASPQEVKRAYREKAKQYHPDVVAHKGQAFAREAEERFKELSKAYAFFRGSAVAT